MQTKECGVRDLARYFSGIETEDDSNLYGRAIEAQRFLTAPWNRRLLDRNGRQIDFHVIVRDEDRRGLDGPPGQKTAIPRGRLSRRGRSGRIFGRARNCGW